jgi:hypothetical protein
MRCRLLVHKSLQKSVVAEDEEKDGSVDGSDEDQSIEDKHLAALKDQVKTAKTPQDVDAAKRRLKAALGVRRGTLSAAGAQSNRAD